MSSSLRLTTLFPDVTLSVSLQMSKFSEEFVLGFLLIFFASCYFLFHTCYKCFVSPKQDFNNSVKREKSVVFMKPVNVILISYQNMSYYYIT